MKEFLMAFLITIVAYLGVMDRNENKKDIIHETTTHQDSMLIKENLLIRRINLEMSKHVNWKQANKDTIFVKLINETYKYYD